VVTLCRTNLMVDSVAEYLKLPMQTGPGIDTPETPGHEHPHPTADGLDTHSISGGAAERRTVISSAADAARASRLGFRRPRA